MAEDPAPRAVPRASAAFDPRRLLGRLLRSPLRLASRFALWPALYVAACQVVFRDVLGVRPTIRGVLCAALTAWGVYLIHRVGVWPVSGRKVASDGGPEVPRARRARHHRVMAAFDSWRRGVAVCAVVGAIAVAWTIHPAVALLVPAAIVGVLVYGGRARVPIPRPRDVVVVKNLAIAGAITVFAVTLSAFTGGAGPVDLAVVGSAAPLLVIVFCDSVLCDVEDVRADREHGALSVPMLLGARRTVVVCLAGQIGVCLWLIGSVWLVRHVEATGAGATGAAAVSPAWVAPAWGAALGVTSLLGLLSMRLPDGPAWDHPRLLGVSLRDVVDLRLPVLAAVIHAAVMVAG